MFVPLAFMAGEAFQFDWSEDWAIISGERTKLQVAHFKLGYSRAFVLRAHPQQTHEMLFDAHNHAFRVLGGVPRRGIYDNMRTAVDRVGRGKEERQVNARFSAMVSHFLFEAEFCNPASGWEKGQIEKNVQDARHRLWQPTCQWRLDFPQKRRRKIPQLAGWRSAMRWIGASVFLRPPTALERRWDWRGGGERFGASDVGKKVCVLA